MPLNDPTPTDYFIAPGGSLGLADEEHWDVVMSLIGAEPIDRLIKHPAFPNADYVWKSERLIIELKNLTVDLADKPGFSSKILRAIDGCGTQKEEESAVASVIRTYVKDIVNSANKQIKESKKELNFSDYKGLVLIVNSGFATLSFPAAMRCFRSIVMSYTQFRSISGLIYIEDCDRSALTPDTPSHIGLLGTRKMTTDTEASMLMITQAWRLYLQNPWLRTCRDPRYAIRFDHKKEPDRHWRPSDIRAYICEII